MASRAVNGAIQVDYRSRPAIYYRMKFRYVRCRARLASTPATGRRPRRDDSGACWSVVGAATAICHREVPLSPHPSSASRSCVERPPRRGRYLPQCIASILAVVLSAGLFAPAAGAEAPAGDPEVAAFEVEFLTGMIDHHQMALHMSDLCLQKAEHAELLDLCRTIQASQAAEIDEMQGWLVDWYGIEHAPMMDDPAHHAQMIELEGLSGADFEIAFLTMMSEHHAMAVEDGRTCLRMAGHRELRALCRDIVATQLREIARMESWLCSWYGDCRFAYLRSR